MEWMFPNHLQAHTKYHVWYAEKLHKTDEQNQHLDSCDLMHWWSEIRYMQQNAWRAGLEWGRILMLPPPLQKRN